MTNKWSYALNQWRPTYDSFVRAEQHERALKTLSACGFSFIELNCGPGRWEPMGNREMIEANHGSLSQFRAFLGACGIRGVSSFFLDPGAFLSKQNDLPLSIANPGHHSEIIDIAQGYLAMLPQLGGDRLIVRAAPSFWRCPDPTPAAIETFARCWNGVASASAAGTVQIGLHVDCLSSVRSESAIAALLEATDPHRVGLALDTAECAIAGMDPVHLWKRFATRVNHVQLKDAIEVDEFGEYRLPNAEMQMLSAGGRRELGRWFYEMGTARGRVDFPAVMDTAQALRYEGWRVVESDQSPYPATSAMLNAWYIKHRLHQTLHA
jgi:inosose dehydratase